MTSFKPSGTKRPVIGCTTYHKQVEGLDVFSLATAYTRAIVAAGGIPLLIPLGLDETAVFEMLNRVDGILLPGGGDINPTIYNGSTIHESLRGIDNDRDRVELLVARQAASQNKPLLAICRGHQLFNVSMGGTLWQDVESQMPKPVKHDNYRVLPRNFLSHEVTLKAGSCLSRCLRRDRTKVNSLHHQGIRNLADGLVATAVAPDGLVEGIELPNHPFALGVQWHPENLVDDDPAMLGLFKGLVDAASSD